MKNRLKIKAYCEKLGNTCTFYDVKGKQYIIVADSNNVYPLEDYISQKAWGMDYETLEVLRTTPKEELEQLKKEAKIKSLKLQIQRLEEELTSK
jgi:hypothetical protein